MRKAVEITTALIQAEQEVAEINLKLDELDFGAERKSLQMGKAILNTEVRTLKWVLKLRDEIK